MRRGGARSRVRVGPGVGVGVGRVVGVGVGVGAAPASVERQAEHVLQQRGLARRQLRAHGVVVRGRRLRAVAVGLHVSNGVALVASRRFA
ncbi:unnamed protein product, partial [Iphiclides podalirius]